MIAKPFETLRKALLATSLLAIAAPVLAAPPAAEAAAPQKLMSGLLPVRVEPTTGRVLIQLPAPDADGVMGRYLFASALKTGLGSAPIRADHGMLGPTQLLAFRRIGKKVAVVYENTKFRAPTAEASVQKGARESFPFTTAAMLDIVSTEPGGGVTIDISPFLLRDTIELAAALNGGGGGAEPVGGGGFGKNWKLADNLSAVDPASIKVFPDNIEMEAVQTYVSDTPGGEMDQLTPDARQASLVVHHSLVRLPPPGFVPRRFDIRSGAHGTPVYDYGTPLGDDVFYQLADRFRLEKVDPAAPRSRVKKPIVFYIDNAAPEPIRTALATGVGWWNQAFEAAGFIDAFQVKILTPDIDPQDVRYNVVNWTNRLTRSWSYGGGIIDPRTGEIIKGNVVLGGDRARQDMVIFEALVGAGQTNSGSPNDPVRATLARIAQLGAHEVGHAIGFVHNFAASTQDRASVLDYPGPRMKVVDGRIDLSDAYATGIGTWDKFVVDWLYGDPAPGQDPDAAARAKADAAERAGMRFMTDVDGRAADLAVPFNNMWTDGADMPPDLDRMMDVRRVAIANFGPGALRPGEPLASLRRKFVPVWLLHRYQVEATGKLIGGVDYRYALAGGTAPEPEVVAAADQSAALDAMLRTLSADALTVPADLVLRLSSGTNGRNDPQFDTEVFAGAGAAVFDPLVAADVAAQVTLASLLAPTRLTRVYDQHRRDPSLLGLDELLDRLVRATVESRRDAVGRRIAYRTIIAIAGAARNPGTSPDVAAILSDRLHTIAESLARAKGASEDAEWSRGVSRLLGNEAMLEREIGKRARTPEVPPGMPIGG